MGIGIGWNQVEYEGLNENFHNRGKRSEEQVEVLRLLWTNPVVTFKGKWHNFDAAWIKPLPIQRPIPIYFGGGRNDSVLRRIARLCDGWKPQAAPDEQGHALINKFRNFVSEAGRSPSEVGIDTRVNIADGMENALINANKWKEIRADYVGVNTMRAGFTSLEQHLDALQEFKALLG